MDVAESTKQFLSDPAVDIGTLAHASTTSTRRRESGNVSSQRVRIAAPVRGVFSVYLIQYRRVRLQTDVKTLSRLSAFGRQVIDVNADRCAAAPRLVDAGEPLANVCPPFNVSMARGEHQ